jgi:hypothetical protein
VCKQYLGEKKFRVLPPFPLFATILAIIFVFAFACTEIKIFKVLLACFQG